MLLAHGAKAASVPDAAPLREADIAAAIVLPRDPPVPYDHKSALVNIRAAQDRSRASQNAALQPVDSAIRYGRHEGFDRLVFEWPVAVNVDVAKSHRELLITFDQRAQATTPPESAFTAYADSWPQLLFDIRAEDNGRRYRVEVDQDARFEVKRWNDGRLIVIDLFQPAVGDDAFSAADDEAEFPNRATAPELDQEGDDETIARDPDDIASAGTDEGSVEGEEEEEDDGVVAGKDVVFEVWIGPTLQVGLATAEGDRLADDGDDDGYIFFTDTDIYIEAYATIFDRLDIGATVGLEADPVEETANADETYLYFGNGFGDIQIGRTGGAEDDMALGGDTIAAGTGGIDGDTANLGETQVNTSGDAAKVSYFTPRLGGVQFGVSYTPDTGDEENDNDRGDDLENHIGVGLNYVESIGEAEISIAAVGSFGESEFSSADDLSAFSVGGTLSLGDFELGASYGQTAEDDDFDFATLGVTADISGASAGFGYNFVDEKDDGITHIFVLSGDMPLLTDLELQGDVSYADPEGENGDIASVLALELSY